VLLRCGFAARCASATVIREERRSGEGSREEERRKESLSMGLPVGLFVSLKRFFF
jgi:hypothetical protein